MNCYLNLRILLSFSLEREEIDPRDSISNLSCFSFALFLFFFFFLRVVKFQTAAKKITRRRDRTEMPVDPTSPEFSPEPEIRLEKERKKDNERDTRSSTLSTVRTLLSSSTRRSEIKKNFPLLTILRVVCFIVAVHFFGA